MKGVSSLMLEPLAQLGPLSEAQARTLSLVITASYVGSIYVTNLFIRSAPMADREEVKQPGVPPISATDADGRAPLGVEAQEGQCGRAGQGNEDEDERPKVGDRDHPDTIKRRITGVTVSTGLSIGAVWYVVSVHGDSSMRAAVGLGSFQWLDLCCEVQYAHPLASFDTCPTRLVTQLRHAPRPYSFNWWYPKHSQGLFALRTSTQHAVRSTVRHVPGRRPAFTGARPDQLDWPVPGIGG